MGEGSVTYLYFPHVIDRILELNPIARFIVMLRNPMQMVPSFHARMLYLLEEDTEDFAEAWRLQEALPLDILESLGGPLRVADLASVVAEVELAEKLRRPQSFVSKYERGERRIDVVEFLDIARAVGLDSHEVIRELDHAADRSSGLYLGYGVERRAMLTPVEG